MDFRRFLSTDRGADRANRRRGGPAQIPENGAHLRQRALVAPKTRRRPRQLATRRAPARSGGPLPDGALAQQAGALRSGGARPLPDGVAPSSVIKLLRLEAEKRGARGPCQRTPGPTKAEPGDPPRCQEKT